MATKIPKEDMMWRAEADAHTMAQYQEIINDPKRMKRAIDVAKKQADDLNKRASAMQNVAKFKLGGKVSRKKK